MIESQVNSISPRWMPAGQAKPDTYLRQPLSSAGCCQSRPSAADPKRFSVVGLINNSFLKESSMRKLFECPVCETISFGMGI